MIDRNEVLPRPRWSRTAGRWLPLGAVILSIMPSSHAGAGDLEGEGLADACTSCHGIGGRSQGYIPSIAGIKRAILVQQLKSFRVQAPGATIMNRIARAYTDSEIEALADYYSSVPLP